MAVDIDNFEFEWIKYFGYDNWYTINSCIFGCGNVQLSPNYDKWCYEVYPKLDIKYHGASNNFLQAKIEVENILIKSYIELNYPND